MSNNTTLSVKIDSGDAAMVEDAIGECARMLRRIADRIEAGHDDGVCIDTNGNTAGRWYFEAAESDDDEGEE